jgi:hypothetical protein
VVVCALVDEVDAAAGTVEGDRWFGFSITLVAVRAGFVALGVFGAFLPPAAAATMRRTTTPAPAQSHHLFKTGFNVSWPDGVDSPPGSLFTGVMMPESCLTGVGRRALWWSGPGPIR